MLPHPPCLLYIHYLFPYYIPVLKGNTPNKSILSFLLTLHDCVTLGDYSATFLSASSWPVMHWHYTSGQIKCLQGQKKRKRKKRHKTGCVNKAELVHKAKCLHPKISSKLSATSSLCQTTSTNSANIHSMLNIIMSREDPPPPPKKPTTLTMAVLKRARGLKSCLSPHQLCPGCC